MKNRIKDKTVLITGATSGIGKALSIMLSTMGVKLVLLARDLEKLNALTNELDLPDVKLICADVRNRPCLRD